MAGSVARNAGGGGRRKPARSRSRPETRSTWSASETARTASGATRTRTSAATMAPAASLRRPPRARVSLTRAGQAATASVTPQRQAPTKGSRVRRQTNASSARMESPSARTTRVESMPCPFAPIARPRASGPPDASPERVEQPARRRIHGGQLLGPGPRRRAVAAVAVDRRQRGQRRAVGRVALLVRLQEAQRFVAVPGRVQRDGVDVAEARVGGSELGGAPERGDRFGGPPLAHQVEAQRVHRGRVVGAARERLAQHPLPPPPSR